MRKTQYFYTPSYINRREQFRKSIVIYEFNINNDLNLQPGDPTYVIHPMPVSVRFHYLVLCVGATEEKVFQGPMSSMIFGYRNTRNR